MMIFSVENNSLSYTQNLKNKSEVKVQLLILTENLVQTEKSVVLILVM